MQRSNSYVKDKEIKTERRQQTGPEEAGATGSNGSNDLMTSIG